MSTLAAPPEGAGPPPAAPSRRHTARWVAGGVAGVLVVVAVVAALQPSYQAARLPSPLLGHPAPQFSGTDLAGGRVSLSSYRGRYVYVNFFASWCPPCQAEEPNLVTFAFQQQRAGAGREPDPDGPESGAADEPVDAGADELVGSDAR